MVCGHGLGAGCVSVHPPHSPLHPLCSWYGPRIFFTITVIHPTAAAMEEERERAERKLASLEREIVDLEDTREGLLIMLYEEQRKQATALM